MTARPLLSVLVAGVPSRIASGPPSLVSLLEQAARLAHEAARPSGLLLPADALEVDTYRPLARALRRPAR